ncbi:MAG TPA: hypothetical protein ENN07_02405, partial [candidate division Zixibacteria bacterium]|nr:hypothetical protein [candidate division Zixibacteria bacterium]
MITAKFLYIASLIAILSISAGATIYSAHILVDGEPADTIPQGTAMWIEIICDPGDTLLTSFYYGSGDDGIFDPDELFLMAMGDIWDNIDVDDGPGTLDFDTTLGRILLWLPISLHPGYVFGELSLAADTIIVSAYISPPDTVMHSISGNVQLEGISHPDSIYN